MIPLLNMRKIKDFFDEKIVERALDYVDGEAIFRTYQANNSLFSSCHGSLGIYRQQCNFLDGEIDEVFCTCPAMRDFGPCKHIAAMLIVWLQDNERFQQRTDLKILLSKKSKIELTNLIIKMCKKDPRVLEIAYEIVEGKPIGDDDVDQDEYDEYY